MEGGTRSALSHSGPVCGSQRHSLQDSQGSSHHGSAIVSRPQRNMRLTEGGCSLTGIEGNPGCPEKTAANMGKGTVLPALRKARQESPLREAKVTLESPELDYAMPSDIHKNCPVGGTCGKCDRNEQGPDFSTGWTSV